MKSESIFSNSDPVCAAPTRAEVDRKLWATCEPLKDGSPIVAIGRVIMHDSQDGWTCVDPFVAAVRWEKDASGYEGWHFIRDGMVLASSLEDEVRIDFWNPYPEVTH